MPSDRLRAALAAKKAAQEEIAYAAALGAPEGIRQAWAAYEAALAEVQAARGYAPSV